jgi:type I restriction enzyme S subunit
VKSGWQRKPLAEVCEVVNGGTPKTGVEEYWGGSHLWITPAEMGKRLSPYVDDTERKISDLGLRDSSARMLPPYSVILSSRAPIGHLVINTKAMSTNQGCKGLVPGEKLEHKYLYYYLSSIVDLLDSLGAGATFKELSGGKLKEVSVPLAPLAEQQRIVGILDEAFGRVAAAKTNNEKNIQNARALFHCGFGAITSQEEQRHWSNTTVAAIAEPRKGSIRTGPFGSQLLHGEFVDQGIAVLGIDNAVANEFRWGRSRFITPEKYRKLDRYRVYPRDVLITIMGTCGRCAVVPDDIPIAINTKHLCCITVDKSKCVPEYLHAYFLYHPMAQQFLLRRAKGSIMSGLNMGIIEELPVLLPPLKRQREIVAGLDALKEETKRLESIYERKVEALGALKRSLLHRAYSGEL